MDYMETERIMARMIERQPHVPEWCKAEHMESVCPQAELWRYDTRESMINRITGLIFSRRNRRETDV